MKTLYFVLIVGLVAGCNQAPVSRPIVDATPTPSDYSALEEPTPIAAESPAIAAAADPNQPAQRVVPQFQKPEANEALGTYVEKWFILKEVAKQAPTGSVDAMHNPSSITGYLSQLGGAVNTLKAAQAQVESNLTNAEKARFKQYRAQLDKPDE
jgi:hypothetical protein